MQSRNWYSSANAASLAGQAEPQLASLLQTTPVYEDHLGATKRCLRWHPYRAGFCPDVGGATPS